MAVATPSPITTPGSNLVNTSFLANIQNGKSDLKYKVELRYNGRATLQKIKNYLIMEYEIPPGWRGFSDLPQKVIYDLSTHKFSIVATNPELMKALKAKGLFPSDACLHKPKLSMFKNSDEDTSSALNFTLGTTHLYQTKAGRVVQRNEEDKKIVRDFGCYYHPASSADIKDGILVFGFTDGSLHCMDLKDGTKPRIINDSDIPLLECQLYNGSATNFIIARRGKPYSELSQVLLYNLDDLRVKHTFAADSFVRDENVLYLIDTKECKIKVFNLKTQEITTEFPMGKIPNETIKNAVYSNDRLIVLFNTKLYFWNVKDGTLLASHVVDGSASILNNHPNLNALVLGSGRDYTGPYFLSFWDISTGEFIAKKVPEENEHIHSFGSCLVTTKEYRYDQHLPKLDIQEYGGFVDKKQLKG